MRDLQRSETGLLRLSKRYSLAAPLIVALHGYGDSAEGFKIKTHLDEEAPDVFAGAISVAG